MNLWLVCIISILFAGCASVIEPREIEASAAIHALDAEYVARWKAGDADGVMALLADDAVIVPHHGVPPVAGSDAIRAFWFPQDQPAPVITVFEHRPDEVFVKGDMAVMRGQFALAWSYEGTQTRIPDGNFILVAVRVGEGWKIRMFSWNDDPEAWVREPLR